MGPPKHVCYVCKRKFKDAGMLNRHEKVSDMHKQSIEKSEDHLQQRKDEIRSACSFVRHQIASVEADMTECMNPSQVLTNQRSFLEMQLRQLHTEYAQLQEMLEDHWLSRPQGLAKVARTKPPTTREVQVGGLQLNIGVSSWQGNKEVQEDRCILNMDVTSSDGRPVAGVAVLDGHSGSLCVDMMMTNFQGHLQRCLSLKPTLTGETLGQAATEACLAMDQEFLVRARQHEVLDGSTMILALFWPEAGKQKMMVANVGDSRAVLCRAGAPSPDGELRLQACRLSDDHKPGRPDEQTRIQDAGGVVDIQGVWRVFMPGAASFGGRAIARWGLAVSRAFGDLLLKEPEKYGCAGVKPGGLITAVPEIRVVQLDPEDDRFAIVACDGIWDVFGDDDAVAICTPQSTPEKAAKELNRRAFAAGSDDNLTTVIITWSPAAAQEVE